MLTALCAAIGMLVKQEVITLPASAITIADHVGGVRRPLLVSMAVLVAFGWLSIQRNAVWNDEVLLWEDAAQAQAKLRPHVNLGALYQNARADGSGHRGISVRSGAQ